MKTIVFLLLVSQIYLSQNVFFNKIEKIQENSDVFLYNINAKETKAISLGQLEIQGFTENYKELYTKVYNKAKEIGANAFQYKPFPSLDTKIQKLNRHNFLINLYYVKESDLPIEEQSIILINDSDKLIKISWQNEKINISPHSYILKKLIKGEEYTLSTRKIFGSKIKLTTDEIEPKKFFLISGAKINIANDTGGGLLFKTGDIQKLNKSFADFLLVLLQNTDNQ